MSAFLSPSIDEFILSFDREELEDLSGSADCAVADLDETKLQYALDSASSFLCSYYAIMCCGQKVAMALASSWLILDIARYKLDWAKSRESVKERYESALSFIDKILKIDCARSYDYKAAQALEIEGCITARIRMNSMEEGCNLNARFKPTAYPRNLTRW